MKKFGTKDRTFPPSRIFLLTFLYLALVMAACAGQTNPKTPQITLSTDRIPHPDDVTMRGAGFTPKSNVYSHLRRPDGTEFPVLPMMTNDRGEFTHEIDTLLLSPGVHEVWVIDGTTNGSSNVARFEVTNK